MVYTLPTTIFILFTLSVGTATVSVDTIEHGVYIANHHLHYVYTKRWYCNRKCRHYIELGVYIANQTLILSMIMCIQNLVSISQKRNLTSINGCNAVAKLLKITFYIPKVDLANDNVYTKFGLC